MNDHVAIEELLRESEEQLSGVALTERTRELLRQVTDCKREVEQWEHEPPTVDQRSAMHQRATALAAEVTQVVERSKGPRSQKVRIV